MTEKTTPHLLGSTGRGKQCKNVNVKIDKNVSTTFEAPEGYLATLTTKDFRTYTVRLAKI